jgi:RNA polymerase sigma factor (sigma-70 family)
VHHLAQAAGELTVTGMTNAAHQPDIGRSLRHVCSMVDAVATSDRVGAYRALTTWLASTTTGNMPRHTVEEAVASFLRSRFHCAVPAAVDSGDPSTIDEVVGSLALTGVDGDALTWAVIGYESQYHTKLVWMEANRFAARMSDRTAEDLVGWGWLGLRVALRQFDPGRGFKFSTYACYRIKGAIRDGVRDENPIPKRLLTLQRKVADAEKELGASLGRMPQLAEVAEHIGHTLAPLEALIPRLAPAASIDEMLATSAEHGGTPSILSDDTDPVDEVLFNARAEAVRAAVAALDDNEREAVELLIYESRSLAEARRRTGLSDRELRRRLERGYRQLAGTLAGWAPDAS